MSILIDQNATPVEIKFGMTAEETEEVQLVNVIYLKPHMSVGDIRALEKSSFSMSMTQEDAKKAAGDAGDDSEIQVSFSNVAQMIESLRISVKGWQGPMFTDIRYHRGIWDKLKADECLWWISLVHERIEELNGAQTEPPVFDPNGTDPNLPEPSI